MKPKVKLIGEDGNIFNLIRLANQEFEKQGLLEKADAMRNEINEADSYNQALAILSRYVKII